VLGDAMNLVVATGSALILIRYDPFHSQGKIGSNSSEEVICSAGNRHSSALSLYLENASAFVEKVLLLVVESIGRHEALKDMTVGNSKRFEAGMNTNPFSVVSTLLPPRTPRNITKVVRSISITIPRFLPFICPRGSSVSEDTSRQPASRPDIGRRSCCWDSCGIADGEFLDGIERIYSMGDDFSFSSKLDHSSSATTAARVGGTG